MKAEVYLEEVCLCFESMFSQVRGMYKQESLEKRNKTYTQWICWDENNFIKHAYLSGFWSS